MSTDQEGRSIVRVLPITHAPPMDARFAVEIPLETKKRLRLDDDRSRVVLSEVNRFLWSGPDLRPCEVGDAASVAYGLLPYRLIEIIRIRFVTLLKEHRVRVVGRTS